MYLNVNTKKEKTQHFFNIFYRFFHTRKITRGYTFQHAQLRVFQVILLNFRRIKFSIFYDELFKEIKHFSASAGNLTFTIQNKQRLVNAHS